MRTSPALLTPLKPRLARANLVNASRKRRTAPNRSTVAVRMASPLPKDPSTRDAPLSRLVPRPSTDVVSMEFLQQRARTTRVAPNPSAPKLSSDVVPISSMLPKVRTMRDVPRQPLLQPQPRPRSRNQRKPPRLKAPEHQKRKLAKNLALSENMDAAPMLRPLLLARTLKVVSSLRHPRVAVAPSMAAAQTVAPLPAVPMARVVLPAPLNASAVVRTTKLLPTVPTVKGAAWEAHMAAAPTTFWPPEDPTSRAASATIRLTVAVRTRRHPLMATTRRDAHAKPHSTAAVPTRLLPPRDPSSRAVRAKLHSLAAAPTESPLPRDPITMAVTAPRRNSNVARTKRHRPRDPITRAAPVWRANSAAAPTESARQRTRSSEAAKMSRIRHKRHVDSPRKLELVEITASNTTSTLLMEDVLGSGMVAAMATQIGSRARRSASRLARNTVANTFACCPKALDPVQILERNGTLIRTVTGARSSSMEAAMAPKTDSIVWNSARERVLSARAFVRILNPTKTGISNILKYVFSATCEQPVESGPCNGNFERWFYDNQTDICRPFTYGGCKGNKNNYPTEHSCNYNCRQPGVLKGLRSDLFNCDFFYWVLGLDIEYVLLWVISSSKLKLESLSWLTVCHSHTLLFLPKCLVTWFTVCA